jgi:hypothetical protein
MAGSAPLWSLPGFSRGSRWDDIETARNTRRSRHQRDSNRAIGGTGLIGSKTVAILRQNGIDWGDNGYFRAKVAQEKLIETSGIPYTIIRATQFLEFLGGIADSSADGNIVRLPPCLFQPIAPDEVAPIAAEVALAAPRNGIVEIAGPELAPFNEIVARYLKVVGGRARSGVRTRGPILGRLRRAALARAVGRSGTRPHRSRRMAPPLTDKGRILHLLPAATCRSAVSSRIRRRRRTRGDPRLAPRAAERSRQEQQARARRIRRRRILAWSRASQIRLHLCDRA